MSAPNFWTMEKFPLITTDEGCDDEFVVAEMEKVAESLNGKVGDFFTVSVRSGYYAGVQFFVEEKYRDAENWSEEDAEFEFGKTPAEVVNDYHNAQEAVRKGLEEAKDDLGLVSLVCSARFSNGEAWFRKVG